MRTRIEVEMEISFKITLGGDEGPETDGEDEETDEGADVLGLGHGCQVRGPDS